MIKKLYFILLIVCIFGIIIKSESAAKGEIAKEVSARKWLNVESFSLEANKDNVVVLEFWATWCGPCRDSIPHLRSMREEYRDKGVVFASLTNEDDYVMIKDFCKKNKMNWAIGVGSNSISDYKVRGIPHAFIIVDGKIKWHGHPMNGLNKELDSIVRTRPRTK